MDARFAGSNRLGDRRRRRLAVESDETLESPVELRALEGPAGVNRTVETAHATATPPQSPTPQLPLASLVPLAWWKYALAGFAIAAASAGIVTAGWFAESWAESAGPGIGRLFGSPAAPVAGWFSSLLLGLCAQGALLIRWARSRSAKDFDGRYRVWTWTAVVWALFSLAAGTGAHRALGETILPFWKPPIGHRDVLSWLIPAAGIGLAVFWLLRREMSGCRASRLLLDLAALLYLGASILQLEVDGRLAGFARSVAVEGAALAGHVALIVSM